MQKLLLCSCVHLVLLLLLQGATIDAEERVRSLFACPSLHSSLVCGVAGTEGFNYNDGCNLVRCLGNGRGVSTQRGCPPPNSPAEWRLCRAAAREVLLERLGPFECANIQAASVCADRSTPRYIFNGCNRIECDGAGKVAGITTWACPAGDPAGAYCQLVADSMDGYSMPNPDELSRSIQQEYACPNLAPSVICERSTNGFSYSDGCNSIICRGTNGFSYSDGCKTPSRCRSSDRLLMTQKSCPAPEESDLVGQEYCQQAEREMRVKMERASVRGRCLTPEAVCQGPSVRRISYNDGCNRCRCRATGKSTCTKGGCPSVLMTDEEFADYCKEIGAGVR